MRFGKREILLLALLMAVPLGTWWFIYRPHNAYESELKRQIEAKQEKLRQLNRATGTIGDLREEISSLDEAVGFFRSKLPSEKEIDKVLQELWRLAEQNDLSTKSIRTIARNKQTSLTEDNGPHGEQPIQMKLEGDFKGLYSFLLELENQPRIMRILKMTVRTPKDAPQGHVQAEFVMSIFFEHSDDAVASAGGAR
ncbi:MAG: type 4a pilus biogenesis protein PilO [Phycisphaerae bacterium]